MLVVAEDLGVIPDYVRKVLKELDVCGYKVMRWEKDGEKYIDPSNYYPISLATTSTHDTEPMKSWWETIDKNEKIQFMNMLTRNFSEIPKEYEKIKDIVSSKILSSSSKFVIMTIQDIIASKDRINLPGTTGNHNWSWRIKCSWKKFLEKHKKDFDYIKNEIKKRNA
jgi:4-alpha-glucanotransferase